MENKLLTEDVEFMGMLPLVGGFCKKTEVPFCQSCYEVSSTFYNPNYLTIFQLDGDKFVAYVCGYFITPKEFFVSQVWKSKEGNLQSLSDFLDSAVREKGGTSIVGLTSLDPNVFAPYGFHFKKSLLVKEL